MSPANTALLRRNFFKGVTSLVTRAHESWQSADRSSSCNISQETTAAESVLTKDCLCRGPVHCFGSVKVLVRILRRSGLARLAFLRHLPMNGEFLLSVIFTSRASEGGRQIVVRTGVSRFQSDGGLKRSNRV